jgi:hypothetical protein
MSLSMIQYDDIESKVMLILLASPNRIFTKSELYNEIINKFDPSSYYIDPNFKFRYMIVLDCLPSKYDVKVTNNLITSSENECDDPEIIDNSTIELPSMEDVSEFIVDNDLLEMSNHELAYNLIRGNKVAAVEKVLNNDESFFTISNVNNKTPLRFINTQQMTNLFLDKLFMKILELEIQNGRLNLEIKNINKNIEIKNDINNLSFYEFFINKINLLLNYYKNDIEFVFLISFLVLLLSSDPKYLQFLTFLLFIMIIIGYFQKKINKEL